MTPVVCFMRFNVHHSSETFPKKKKKKIKRNYVGCGKALIALIVYSSSPWIYYVPVEVTRQGYIYRLPIIFWVEAKYGGIYRCKKWKKMPHQKTWGETAPQTDGNRTQTNQPKCERVLLYTYVYIVYIYKKEKNRRKLTKTKNLKEFASNKQKYERLYI